MDYLLSLCREQPRRWAYKPSRNGVVELGGCCYFVLPKCGCTFRGNFSCGYIRRSGPPWSFCNALHSRSRDLKVVFCVECNRTIQARRIKKQIFDSTQPWICD